ncbi:MAG: galactose oxidase-like domain-containing protein [Acidimicrobiales bacterium]
MAWSAIAASEGMDMRKLLIAGFAAGLVLVPSAPVLAGGPSGGTGTYLTPFREDGATFDPATRSFSGGTYPGTSVKTDANGCAPPGSVPGPAGNPDALRCLPAGATVVQLADGRILFWNALEGTENVPNSSVLEGGHVTVNDESRILELRPNGPQFTKLAGADGSTSNEDLNLPLPAPLPRTTSQRYPYNNGGLFCSDQVQLADGRVLTVGGTDYYDEPKIPNTPYGVIELEGIRNARTFDPADNSWRQVAPMNFGRWYPGLVTLADNKVLVASGVTKLIKPLYSPSSADNSQLADSGTNVKHTETYDPSANTWTDNGAAGQRSLPLFPRLHLLPDGHVYYDAAGQDYNPQGQSYDEALWNVAGSYDPATKSWSDLGVPGLGTVAPGFRGSTFSAALPIFANRSGAYSNAAFLTAGGVLGTTPGSYLPVADSRITTVSIGAGGRESLSSVATGPLGRPRWYSTAVPLPDGTVYAVNGADLDEVITPGYESPIRTAELFTPTTATDGAGNVRYTGGSWRDAGEVARPRTYHNNAILLPDGSVLIGGHAPIPSGYGAVKDGPTIPGVREGTNNHHDPSFQVYRPPYFDKVRPVVAPVGRTILRGHSLTLSVGGAPTGIARVVLMRAAAQTHLVDGDARQVVLPVTSSAGGAVTVSVPSGAVLPAGPYMLFVDRAGDTGGTSAGDIVPSKGQLVSVQ